MRPPSGRPLLLGAGTLLVLFAFPGCTGTEPTPVVPNLVGEYSGVWTGDLTVDGQPVPTAVCSCTFTVPTQVGDAFYARSQFLAPCEGTLTISDGRVESSGAITFTFTGEETRGTGSRAGGCIVTATGRFSGTFSGNTIAARRSESVDCTAIDGHRYSSNMAVTVTRQ